MSQEVRATAPRLDLPPAQSPAGALARVAAAAFVCVLLAFLVFEGLEEALAPSDSAVSDALRLLRHDRRMRAVAVQEAFDPETPPVFMIEDHLIQVVLNLLLNALDAMPQGGALRIEVGAAAGQVALRVRDGGVGMDRGVLARAFEPLFTTKEPGRGTGLGLSISRDIVRAAGGEIELHSAPGRGTTAVVTLPAFAAAPAASLVASGPGSAAANGA